MLRDPLVDPIRDFLVELVHAGGREGQHESQHLVEAAPEGPHVRLGGVDVVAPHLRTRVARCASLCLVHLIFEHFANVEVSNLD